MQDNFLILCGLSFDPPPSEAECRKAVRDKRSGWSLRLSTAAGSEKGLSRRRLVATEGIERQLCAAYIEKAAKEAASIVGKLVMDGATRLKRARIDPSVRVKELAAYAEGELRVAVADIPKGYVSERAVQRALSALDLSAPAKEPNVEHCQRAESVDERAARACYNEFREKTKSGQGCENPGADAWLRTLGSRNLYDFVLPEHEKDARSRRCGELLSLSAARARSFSGNDRDEGSAAKKLDGKVKKWLGDQEARRVYDSYLQWSQIDELLKGVGRRANTLFGGSVYPCAESDALDDLRGLTCKGLNADCDAYALFVGFCLREGFELRMPLALKDARFEGLREAPYVFRGKLPRPRPRVVTGGKILREGIDFEYEYDFDGPGYERAEVHACAIGPEYYGVLRGEFRYKLIMRLNPLDRATWGARKTTWEAWRRIRKAPQWLFGAFAKFISLFRLAPFFVVLVAVLLVFLALPYLDPYLLSLSAL